MRRWWWTCCQWTIRFGGAVLWQLRAYGLENIPREGGVLLASNHQSYLDPPLVGAFLPREMHFMARKSLFRNRFFGALIRAMNAFPIERDSADLRGVREALARLKAGNILLVFPEGTRTRTGAVGPMKAGIGMLAERAGVPIVPVLIQGAHKVWPKGRGFPGLGRVSIVFGRPLPRESGAEGAVGDRLREAVLGLKGELQGCRTASS